jgi:hypothetical protein
MPRVSIHRGETDTPDVPDQAADISASEAGQQQGAPPATTLPRRLGINALSALLPRSVASLHFQKGGSLVL